MDVLTVKPPNNIGLCFRSKKTNGWTTSQIRWIGGVVCSVSYMAGSNVFNAAHPH